MRVVPKPRTDLNPADAEQVRKAWASYRRAQKDAEKSRRDLVRLLRQMQRHYPVASIARAARVTPPAVWNKLKGES